jgi:hypothetical protein
VFEYFSHYPSNFSSAVQELTVSRGSWALNKSTATYKGVMAMAVVREKSRASVAISTGVMERGPLPEI